MEDSPSGSIRLYARNSKADIWFMSQQIYLKKNEWTPLSLSIPENLKVLIDEVGFVFEFEGNEDLTCFLDNIYFSGKPRYIIDFSYCEEEYWNSRHIEIEQFTRLKGITYLKEGFLHLSCHDFAEMYTGHLNWDDYSATFFMTPCLGDDHYVNFRVQGAIRSYAVGFSKGKLNLMKNENGYRILLQKEYEWNVGTEYIITTTVKGNTIAIFVNGKEEFNYIDEINPYLNGGIGLSVRNGSHCSYMAISVE